MDTGRVLLIFCFVGFLAFAVPATIYFWARRENTSSMVRIMRRAAVTARQPLKKQNEDLEELARRVAALKHEVRDPPPESDQPDEH